MLANTKHPTTGNSYSIQVILSIEVTIATKMKN